MPSRAARPLSLRCKGSGTLRIWIIFVFVFAVFMSSAYLHVDHMSTHLRQRKHVAQRFSNPVRFAQGWLAAFRSQGPHGRNFKERKLRYQVTSAIRQYETGVVRFQVWKPQACPAQNPLS